MQISKPDLWPEQHQWLKEKLERFHKVFAPLVKNWSSCLRAGEMSDGSSQFQLSNDIEHFSPLCRKFTRKKVSAKSWRLSSTHKF